MAPNVAVVGVTGAVGQEFLSIIEERKFPFKSLRVLASGRSAGKKIPFKGKEYTVEELRPESFEGVDLAIAPGLSSAKFHESVADFGVVYGLGLQGLGMARIESNLLPTSVARSMAWAGKTKFFIGAAVLFLLVLAGLSISAQPINLWALIVLIVGVFPFILALRRWRNSRKAL